MAAFSLFGWRPCRLRTLSVSSKRFDRTALIATLRVAASRANDRSRGCIFRILPMAFSNRNQSLVRTRGFGGQDRCDTFRPAAHLDVWNSRPVDSIVPRRITERSCKPVEATRLLDDIAIAVLDGQAIRTCATANGLSPHQVEAVVNLYCRRANPVVFRALQPGRYFVDLRISEPRLQRHHFVPSRPASEPITLSSSIWSLPGVPTVTLGGFYDGGIDTIDDLVTTPIKTLSRLPKVGPERNRRLAAKNRRVMSSNR